MCDRSKDVNAKKCESDKKCHWCYNWNRRNPDDFTYGIACFGYMVNPVALRHFLFSKNYIENLDDNYFEYENNLFEYEDQKYIITEGCFVVDTHSPYDHMTYVSLLEIETTQKISFEKMKEEMNNIEKINTLKKLFFSHRQRQNQVAELKTMICFLPKTHHDDNHYYPT